MTVIHILIGMFNSNPILTDPKYIGSNDTLVCGFVGGALFK